MDLVAGDLLHRWPSLAGSVGTVDRSPLFRPAGGPLSPRLRLLRARPDGLSVSAVRSFLPAVILSISPSGQLLWIPWPLAPPALLSLPRRALGELLQY